MNKVLTVVGIYHPPTKHFVNNSNAIFITEFLDFMSELQLSKKNIVILCNFNLHVNDKSDTDAQQFIDMVEASGKKQWIDFATHKQGNILDLIITELAVEVQIKMSILTLIYLTTAPSLANAIFQKQRWYPNK